MKTPKTTKSDRDAFRKKMLGIIKRRGVISTRDLAHELGVEYSQVYIPLAHSSEVKEFKRAHRRRYWALTETKFADVKEQLADYTPISPVRRGRPAAVAA